MKRILLILFLIPSILLARTPTIQEVHQEALRYAGYDQRELHDWKKKSKWSAALPRFQVGLDRDMKDVAQLTTSDNVSISGGEVTIGPDENRFDRDFQQGLGFDVHAVWYLDQLIFGKNRLEVSRETRSWLEDRSRLLERVTGLYYEWRREKNRSIREELAGRIDAYTNGWFSDELRRKK